MKGERCFMQEDDLHMGRVLTRRQVLALTGAAFITAFAPRTRAQAAALPQCIARPEQTEGPFFVDEKLNRSDIRSDPATGAVKPGVPLRVAFRVMRVDERCTPIAGAVVDLWQCDAAGAYSGVRDFGGSTVGQKFLRGYQVTDANGLASFTTIYPGWYRGRTVHLHFKVRTQAGRSRAHEFTSQLYFDDGLTDRILAREPYANRGARDRRNEQDGLFARGGGRNLVLAVKEEGQGYTGTFDIGLRST